MADLKYMTHLEDTEEVTGFLNNLIETLRIIANRGVDVDKIKENVIFVFPSLPALISGNDGRSVIIAFNLQKVREDIEENKQEYDERVKDIIAHEIAHYVIGNYNQRSTREIESETDDLSESWGFGRAYTFKLKKE